MCQSITFSPICHSAYRKISMVGKSFWFRDYSCSLAAFVFLVILILKSKSSLCLSCKIYWVLVRYKCIVLLLMPSFTIVPNLALSVWVSLPPFGLQLMLKNLLLTVWVGMSDCVYILNSNLTPVSTLILAPGNVLVQRVQCIISLWLAIDCGISQLTTGCYHLGQLLLDTTLA